MTYIIGEIGQNHNGSVDIAKAIIDVVTRPVYDKLFGKKLPRMDAVKLTKRDLEHELSASQMARPYNSPHSFGKTYGEHRKYLELDNAQHFECYQYAKEKGLDFVETLCAIGCLSILDYFTPDKLKVASRDLTNLPLLDALAQTKIPIIVSTGMAREKDLDEALAIITKHHEQISILHCVSQYPAEYENVNLRTIPYLKRKYPQYTIGYSDHTVGIATPVAAVAMGAEIIEKHITLDRQMRGTDQSGSLEIDGIYRMVRDIRNLELSFGTEEIKMEAATKEAREKLERSIATLKSLPEGHILTEEDVHLLSPGDGFQWSQRTEIIGKKLKNAMPKDEIIYQENLQ
ncbi:MAG: shikimate dehydrogenase [Flavobacteriaceae bacterium]|jgi:sialic acid synthase|nr:shikimate dehydrogenase [Flavobacteriaceae bacterium]MAM28023.1 shikimate dehydrogenase [Flavobacteriaceae bacterium]MAY54011.1 shikimate dehydrogenase [Flavobacteriaceae bacterium]|tara:strand:+ start:201 stop:1235 length:1035 start_codon:yes stop_codon:yes gene_type:complete